MFAWSTTLHPLLNGVFEVEEKDVQRRICLPRFLYAGCWSFAALYPVTRQVLRLLQEAVLT